jgi:hypothetical protein
VPGTRVLGDQTDQLGRRGIAISFSLRASRENPAEDSKIIVSAKTGDLLEVDVLLTKAADGMPAGAVSQREIFLQSGFVDSVSALPGGGTQPYKLLEPKPPRPRSSTSTTATRRR